jgi:hypothetical protein
VLTVQKFPFRSLAALRVEIGAVASIEKGLSQSADAGRGTRVQDAASPVCGWHNTEGRTVRHVSLKTKSSNSAASAQKYLDQ